MNSFNENIIDTEFEEINSTLLKDKNINKEPLYYSRTQVAKILEEKESTISYWSKEFQPILNLKIINMNRKYTKKDVENLLFIQKLIREDGMAIKQVLEYCSEKGFSKNGLIDTQNPLAEKIVTTAILDEFDKKISEMQNQVILQQKQLIDSLQQIIIQNNTHLRDEFIMTVNERNDSLKENINSLVDIRLTEQLEEMKTELALTKEDNKQLKNTIQNKLEEQYQQIQDNFENLDNKNKERDIVLVDSLLQKMNERKEENRKINELQEKQSLFSRIFNKKK